MAPVASPPRTLALALALLAAACTTAAEPERGPVEAGPCGVSEPVRGWVRNGYHPERSGEVQFLPADGTVVGRGLSHAPPSELTQRVPLFWYGPSVVRAAGRVGGPATVADVAPTVAGLIGFDFDAPDGRVLPEVVTGHGEPPRLVVLMVWDAVGTNVLEEHPESWPNLRRVLEDGVWYEDAVVGSSPSNTPAVHATMGTGAFPRSHGRVTSSFWMGGRYVESEAVGPADLLVPGLADVYAAGLDNEPVTGVVGSRGWHLGMLGQGSAWPGTEPHLAVLTDPETGDWGLLAQDRRHFRFPEYVHGVQGLDELVRALDLESGELDGTWLGEPVLEDPTGLILTPAWTEHQTRVIEEVVRREGFGADGVPDLLFTNYKQLDLVAHRWGMHGPQARAALEATDRAFGELLAFLDREVGEGRWAIAVTSDHGFVPSPEVSGDFLILDGELSLALQDAFGGPEVIVAVHSTQAFVDVERLEAAGHTLEDVAGFVASYTRGANAEDPAALPAEERDDLLFPVAFRGAALDGLSCPSG